MKKSLLITAAIMLAVIFLTACRAPAEPEAIESSPEQSQVPFLGLEELAPLFAGRYTIADWIRDISFGNARYSFFIEGATGYARMDVMLNDDWVSSFYIEDNPYADFLRHDSDSGIYTTLPNEILALRVTEVLHLDFEAMGIPWNIRGITRGASADNVTLAFLDARHEGDVLYGLYDVVPNAQAEVIYGAMFVGGIDRRSTHRTIQYFHTIPSSDYTYTIYCYRTIITFRLDENDKIIGFNFADVTHRN
ncbi:MAG: hypothetical protein FWE04_02240 [Oscillospiraceae bacterium]|nr:hypothetical protein [Oscillospiraceae bacterium]